MRPGGRRGGVNSPAVLRSSRSLAIPSDITLSLPHSQELNLISTKHSWKRPVSVAMAERSASKLDEQATGKGELSYSYWAAGNDVKDAAPAPQPKKISEEEAAALLRTASAGGASAWNAAGTFEERTCPDAWVQETVRELMIGAAGEGGATVTEVVSASGDCNQWVVRGSIRANFDLDVKLKWQVEVGGEKRAGTVR